MANNDTLHHSLGLIFLGFGMALLMMSLAGVEDISSGTLQLVFVLALALMGVGVGGRIFPPAAPRTSEEDGERNDHNDNRRRGRR